MPSTILMVAFSGIATAYIFLWALLHLTQDSSEPPLVLSSMPFISPLLGMIKWSMNFYAIMRKRYEKFPMYTLRIPGVRIYVVNSLDLIPIMQRQWRTLIFAPISVKAAKAVMGVSKDSISILGRDLITESGFINGMIKVTHPTMSNGPALDALNAKAFDVFNHTLKRFDIPKTISMFKWIDEQIMRATTDAVYGPSHPMQDASNLEAWRKYHPAIMFLMLDILPQNIFFRAAVKSREKLVQSFAKYYQGGGYKQGSAYIQEFTRHCINHQIPEADLPRLLLGTVFNNVANTTPSAFWVIYHIFSDPVVLQDCRNEVEQAVQDDHEEVSTIDLSFILNSCPVLLSTYHEVFRYHGMANSVRVVSEDHMLDNRYLVKKGGLVMMSARAQHSNPAVWGADVDQFYHKRFMKKPGSSNKRLAAVAFRGFGGGTTLCPGRHFATSEILLLAALLLLRFDIKPVKGRYWPLPSTAKSSQAEAMEQPDDDFNVVLVPRVEANSKTWRIAF